MNNQNWDDIRYVLAVAKYGSLNAAASALGVTHATVMRRVTAFEVRYNCQVFAKSPSGYTVLPEAFQILDALENIEGAVLATERTLAGADQSPEGRVRIASTDSLSQLVLPEILGDISGRYPKIELSLLSANAHHDLTQMTADIAVRATKTLGDGLVGQRAGYLRFAVYSDGAPDRKWMKLHGPLGKSIAGKWMDDNTPDAQITGGADSFLVLKQMAASGVGKVLLPTLAGDKGSRLHRIDAEDPGLAVPIWVTCLEDFARTPRIALVRKLLHEQLEMALEPFTGPIRKPS